MTWMREQDTLRVNSQWGQIAHVARDASIEYASPAFLAHMLFNHCGDHALSLMARAESLFGLNLQSRVAGQKKLCHGCHMGGRVPRNQGMHKGKLVERVLRPGESLNADLTGEIRPMGINRANYMMVVVDEFSKFTWVFPLQKKSQAARLMALLVQRINAQIRRKGEPGVRLLHTDKGGEFASHSLQQLCDWKGIILS